MKGSPSPDPASYFTDAELEAKFRHNAGQAVRADAVEGVVETVGRLDHIDDVNILMDLLRPAV